MYFLIFLKVTLISTIVHYNSKLSQSAMTLLYSAALIILSTFHLLVGVGMIFKAEFSVPDQKTIKK